LPIHPKAGRKGVEKEELVKKNKTHDSSAPAFDTVILDVNQIVRD